MIELENVSFGYGDRVLFEKVTFALEKGSRIAICGPSGCGKTSLLRLIAGLEKPLRGTVSAGGSIAFVFQEPRLLPWFDLLENVEAVGCGRERALRLITAAELGDAADKLPGQLSGGMQQRAAVVRALASDADILLLDEPFKGLDAELKSRIIRLISEEAQGKAIVLVTHDESEAEALGCRKITVNFLSN